MWGGGTVDGEPEIITEEDKEGEDDEDEHKDDNVQKEYTVTFQTNGGSYVTKIVKIKKGSPYGTLPDLTREGYKFLGWYTENGIRVQASDVVPGNVTLYARWEVENVTEKCTVTFDANGGVCDTPTAEKEKGSTYGQLPEATRDGYNFLGWYTERDNGSQVKADDVVTGDITLYAQWEATNVTEKCTVTFDANGGSCDTLTAEKEKDSTYGTLPEATRDGYNFLGWYTQQEGGSKVEASDVVTGDVTLYAQWEAEIVIITFHGNGKTATQEVQSGVSTPLKAYSETGIDDTGYVFKGWAETENGLVKYADGDAIEITQNIDLYGVFEEDAVTATLSITNNGAVTSKLTEGTKLSIGATASSGIQKVELTVGEHTMYSKEIAATEYTDEIELNELEDLDKLLFYSNNDVILTVTTTSNATKQASQSGVQNFTVGSAESLKELARIVNAGNTLEGETVLQIAHIDLNGSSDNKFPGIGRFGENSYPFSGIYNGNHYEINNVYIDVTEDVTMGLFGYCFGTIKNVTASGKLYKNLNASRLTGGIVGRAENATISNCTNKIDIIAANEFYIGGICGGGDATIENCINEGSVTGKWYTGGICSGRMLESKLIIKNCENKGNVTAQYLVGGIVGYTDCAKVANVDMTKYQIIECVNEGDIIAQYKVGGIAGESRIDIRNSYNSGIITSTGNDPSVTDPLAYTGGIVGINNGIITQCVNEGFVDAVHNVDGGIAGRNLGTISYCVNTGNVSGNSGVGGIVGNNRGYISYVYNSAEEIEATTSKIGHVGGIIGNQNSTADAYTKNAYNRAEVIGNVEPGGIVGVFSIGTMNNCYNIGTISGSATNAGEIYGSTYSTTAITNCESTTESAMLGWNQTTITANLGNFVKKTDSLPILNITVNGKTF